jgi:6-phosphogluconolactonase
MSAGLSRAVREHCFADTDALASALAEAVADHLRTGLRARRQASIVLSGGRSPVAAYARLAALDLDWEKVTLTLADERWVPPEDPASNEAMVRRVLLQGTAAATARFVGLFTGDATPEAGAEAARQRVEAVARPFDVVLLGMGEDGHTASLFPEGDRLADALSPASAEICAPMRAPGAGEPRITLTLPVLLDTRALFLVFEGPAKRRVFEAALDDGPDEAMPIRAVLRHSRVPVDVFFAS